MEKKSLSRTWLIIGKPLVEGQPSKRSEEELKKIKGKKKGEGQSSADHIGVPLQRRPGAA